MRAKFCSAAAMPFRVATCVCAFSLAHNIFAQATTSSADDDAVVLSVFEVNTSRDVGYTATSTLAGSRMNSDLRDTPTAISVMTKQFLEDIAATSLNEVVEYGLNVAESFDATGNGVTENNFGFTIRGIGGAQRARNYFRSQLNADLYNIERVDIARGPNSILFGEASPAGLMNASTKFARIGRDFGSVQLRVASYDSLRGSVDINQTLGEKAALRLNVLKQEADGYRDFEFQDKDGIALSGTWRPFRQTQLKFEGEKIDISENRARPWPGYDRYTTWVDAGSPLTGTPTQWGQRIVNENARTGQNTMLYFNNGPLAGNVLYTGALGNNDPENFRVSLGSINIPGLNTAVNTSDFSRHPRNGNLAGPSARSSSDGTLGSVYLEQGIGEDFVMEFAAGSESEKRIWLNPVGFSSLAVFYDANGYLPTYDANGVQTGIAANPAAGKQIIVSSASRQNYTFDREQARATASYHLDFKKVMGDESKMAKILGHHRMAALYSTETFVTERESYNEVNVSPTRLDPNLFNSTNRIARVSYVDMFSSNLADRGLADIDLNPITSNPMSGTSRSATDVVGRTVDAEFARSNWRWNKNQLDTTLFASHSFFWDDRIVVLFGLRNDTTTTYSSDRTLDAATSEAIGFVRRATPDREDSGDTSTRGLVFHATPWLSLFYNEADNFAVQDSIELFNDIGVSNYVTNRVGDGKDAGFKTSLFGGKLNASFAWYQTADANQLAFINGVYTSWVNRIWLSLNASDGAQFPVIKEVEGRDTRSLVSEGYEFELTANPTRQLRLSLNLKSSETTNSDLIPNVQAYVGANRAVWESNSNVSLTAATNGAETIGELVTLLDQQILFDLAAEGFAPARDRKVTANVTANYTFNNELLKGFGVGSALQYRGKSVIGYRALTDGSAVYAPGYTNTNLWFSYSRKINQKYRLRLQFNIDNLFDFQDEQPVSSGQVVADNPRNPPTIDGIAYVYSLPLPRRYSFSATLSF